MSSVLRGVLIGSLLGALKLSGCGGDRASVTPVDVAGPPARVQVVSTADGGWQLLRDGRPYVVQGVGLVDELDAFAAAGGNSLRTWGIDDQTPALLDAAHAHGLTVTLGLWMGHVEHGFDYGDEAAVAAQLERLRDQVERFKAHPALLMWGVGNEVELEGGDTPRIWQAVEQVAAMVKATDPDHPTLLVTAEIGAAHEQRLRTLMPSIDVWGINSYGGAASLPDRLTARGYSGPYLLTEYGGAGAWEVPKTPWGAAVEQSSTEKAAAYRIALEGPVRGDPRSLGGYAFVWGRGAGPLDTWFALFGPPGVRYEPIDTLQSLWGRPAADRAPSGANLIAPFDGQVVEPAGALEATLDVTDPEGRPLAYDWVLHRDTLKIGVDIDSGAGAPVQCIETDAATVRWTAPTDPGPYRLLAVARDAAGGAAYASARFHVGEPGAAPVGLGLPFWVDRHFAPSGWMGDATHGALEVGDCPPRPGYCTGPCRRFTQRPGPEGWAGVVWHHPNGNWQGEQAGRAIRPGAVAVEFTAWSDRPSPVSFSVGNRLADGFEVTERIELGTAPRTHRLSLTGLAYTDVAYGFAWTAPAPAEERTIFVADVRWVSR